MNRSLNLIQEAISYFGEAKKTFKLKKPVEGVSFDSKKTIVIPAGTYVVVDDDDRSSNRFIIANKKDQEMYAISKELAKN